MNHMNIPGLTAEASLYRTNGYSWMAGTRAAMANSREVLPQLPIGFCQANCDQIQDDFLRTVCEIRCSEQGSGGGDGVGSGHQDHLCRPGCGPCQHDPSSSSGRSRTCIKSSCDDFTRKC